MPTEVSVPISFLAKFDQATKGIGEFANKAESSLSGIQGHLGLLTTVAGGIAGAFAFGKLVHGFADLVRDAAQAQQGIFQLANAMKSAGDFSNQNIEAFKALADQISRTTTFDNDLVISQFSLAKQFGATNKEAASLVQAATELATRAGIDLPTATNFLGRSLDGTAGRLNELIPQMRSLTVAELENNGAAKLILQLYGGTAAAATETFGGAISQLHNAFEDFRKSLGASVVDNTAAVQGIQLLTKFFHELQKVVEDNKEALFDFVSNGVILTADSFIIFLQVGKQIQQFFEELIHYATSLGTELAILPERLKNIITLNFSANENLIKAVRLTEEEDKQNAIARLNVYDQLSQKVSDFSVGLERAKNSNQAIAKTTEAVAAGFDKQTTSFKRFSAELAQKAKAILDDLKTQGVDDIDTLTKKYLDQVNTLNEALKKGVIKEREYVVGTHQLKVNFENKLHELKKKHFQEELAEAKEVFENPIGFFTGQFSDQKLAKEPGQQALSAGLGLGADVLNGQQGAIKLAGQAAAAAGIALLGPAGQALGPIVEILAQGPDKVHKMVDEFLKALPQIVKNIVLSIPEIIETVIDNIPQIIDAFIDAIPEVIDKLIEKAPELMEKLAQLMPRVAERLIQKAPEFVAKMIAEMPKFIAAMVRGAGAFVTGILGGATGFVGKILEGAGQFVQKLIESIGGSGIFGGGDGGGVGGFISDVGDFLGFAEGGTVPDGFPNDRLVARLSSKENVVDRSTNEKLNRFLDNDSGGSQTLHLNIQVGEAKLAKVVANLNRRGFRTA